MIDDVNNPSHYVKASATVEPIVLCEQLDFCLGNFCKYILRADFKGNKKQDLQKALYYLERAYFNGEFEDKKVINKLLKLSWLAFAFKNERLTHFFDAFAVVAVNEAQKNVLNYMRYLERESEK